MCSINLVNKFNLKENIILYLITIISLIVANTSLLAMPNRLIVYNSVLG